MTTTRAGEIWLAEVEFPDGRGSKPRPMLVLFADAHDSILVVITSAPARSERDLVIRDWSASGLRLPSTARLDRLLTISHRRLWAKLGRLAQDDWRRIVEVWNERMRLSAI
jgi:mRNA-degrading endonuclease toxin of MazEF toxin-antitoxin module